MTLSHINCKYGQSLKTLTFLPYFYPIMPFWSGGSIFWLKRTLNLARIFYEINFGKYYPEEDFKQQMRTQI